MQCERKQNHMKNDTMLQLDPESHRVYRTIYVCACVNAPHTADTMSVLLIDSSTCGQEETLQSVAEPFTTGASALTLVIGNYSSADSL